MKDCFSLWKKLVLKPSEGLKEMAGFGYGELSAFLGVSALLYSLLVSAVNIALIYAAGVAASIPINVGVFFGIIFASFFAGLLLVVAVYAVLSHIVSLAFVKAPELHDSFRIAVAAFVPASLFTWLSPVIRAAAAFSQPALGMEGAGLLAGQIINQVAAVLFGSFSIWLIWALLIHLLGFSHFHKAAPDKVVPFILVCSIILMIVWNLLASLPLILIQSAIGF